MSTIMHDFFYQNECQSQFTRVINKYIFDHVEGLKDIGNLCDLEELYFNIIDLLIEYKESSSRVDEIGKELFDYSTKRKRIFELIEGFKEQDYHYLSRMIDNDEQEDYDDYEEYAEKKQNIFTELELINYNDISVRNEKKELNSRIKEICASLERLYARLVKEYHEEDIDRIKLELNEDSINYLADVFGRRVNDRREGEYIANEVYNTLLDELSYYLEVLNDIRVLLFADFDDAKYDELVASRTRIGNIRNYVVLKKDLLQHIYDIDHSQKDTNEFLKARGKVVPAKKMIDLSSEYLDAVRSDNLSDYDVEEVRDIMVDLAVAMPKKDEDKYVKRLLSPYIDNANGMIKSGK